MAQYTIRHPGEGREPNDASLDSGLRRKDICREEMTHKFADVKLFKRQYTNRVKAKVVGNKIVGKKDHMIQSQARSAASAYATQWLARRRRRR